MSRGTGCQIAGLNSRRSPVLRLAKKEKSAAPMIGLSDSQLSVIVVFIQSSPQTLVKQTKLEIFSTSASPNLPLVSAQS